MRFRLTQELCYFAGLVGRQHWPERSRLGIRTSNKLVEERFVEYAMKLGVEPNKILISDEGDAELMYFYHSKISRMVREVMEMRPELAGKGRGLAEAFVAGTFDANGHMLAVTVSIRGLQSSDELLLARMGIHTVHGKVLNIRDFMRLEKGISALLGESSLGLQQG